MRRRCAAPVERLAVAAARRAETPRPTDAGRLAAAARAEDAGRAEDAERSGDAGPFADAGRSPAAGRLARSGRGSGSDPAADRERAAGARRPMGAWRPEDAESAASGRPSWSRRRGALVTGFSLAPRRLTVLGRSARRPRNGVAARSASVRPRPEGIALPRRSEAPGSSPASGRGRRDADRAASARSGRSLRDEAGGRRSLTARAMRSSSCAVTQPIEACPDEAPPPPSPGRGPARRTLPGSRVSSR